MVPDKNSTVYVIDPDATVVAALKKLFASVHVHAEYFESAADCLACLDRTSRGCVIADATAPGVFADTFQQLLRREGIELPVIFLSNSGDVATAVKALKCGAADFLEKPFNGQVLLDTVHRAIDTNWRAAHERSSKLELRTRFDGLTPREWEVVLLMIKGCSNRRIAEELGISQKTVEVYRSRIMSKTRTANLPELIRIAIRIDLLGELNQNPLNPDCPPPLRRAGLSTSTWDLD